MHLWLQSTLTPKSNLLTSLYNVIPLYFNHKPAEWARLYWHCLALAAHNLFHPAFLTTLLYPNLLPTIPVHWWDYHLETKHNLSSSTRGARHAKTTTCTFIFTLLTSCIKLRQPKPVGFSLRFLKSHHFGEGLSELYSWTANWGSIRLKAA